jgi:hypothetical protein
MIKLKISKLASELVSPEQLKAIHLAYTLVEQSKIALAHAEAKLASALEASTLDLDILDQELITY